MIPLPFSPYLPQTGGPLFASCGRDRNVEITQVALSGAFSLFKLNSQLSPELGLVRAGRELDGDFSGRVPQPQQGSCGPPRLPGAAQHPLCPFKPAQDHRKLVSPPAWNERVAGRPWGLPEQRRFVNLAKVLSSVGDGALPEWISHICPGGLY